MMIRLFLIALTGICGLAGASPTNDRLWIRFPEVSIPHLSHAPTIDGTIGAKEWAMAAKISGFVLWNDEPGQGKLVEDPMAVYLGWTDERLFVAFHEVRPKDYLAPSASSPGQGGDTGDRSPINGDNFELRLSPACQKLGGRGPFEDYIEFVGNYLGDYSDFKNSGEGVGWRGGWTYRARRTPDGWEGELSIPFSSLPKAQTPPAPGSRWGIGFVRNRRTPRDAQATWEARIGGSQAWNYPHAWARFEKDGPVVRVNQAGPLTPDAVGLDCELLNPGDKPLQTKVELKLLRPKTAGDIHFYKAIEDLIAGEGQIVIGNPAWAIEQVVGNYEAVKTVTNTVSLAPNSSRQVGFLEKAPFGSYVLLVRVADAATDQTIYARSVPFDFTKPSQFQVTFVPYYLSSDTVLATLANPGKALAGKTIQYEIRQGREKRDEGSQTIPPWPEFRLQIPVQNVAFDSTFDIVLRLLDADGKKLDEETYPMRKPPKPAWFGNTFGITSDVPPPWTPVQANANAVKVWGREYQFGGRWLPSEIHSNGQQILDEPARLVYLDAEGEHDLTIGTLRLAEKTKRAATYVAQNTVGGLDVSARVTVEFDGFLWCSVTVNPKKPRRIRGLTLLLPLKSANALFYQEADMLGFKNFRTAPHGNQGAIPKEGTTAPWMYRLYVGDHERGLWWFTESSQCWNTENDKDVVQIAPEGGRTVVKIHLRRGDEELSQELRYAFGLQATPVKPYPLWLRKTRYSFYFPGKNIENLEECMDTAKSYLQIQDTDRRMDWYCLFSSWNAQTFGQPFPSDDATAQRLKRFVKFLEDHKAHTMVYGGWGIIRESKWVDQAFSAEMAYMPLLKHWANHYRECPASPFQDYHLGGCHYLADLGVRGIYYDGTMLVGACQGIGHGCGWVDDAGVIHATYPVRKTREQFMRVYQLFNERFGYGNAFIWSHYGPGSFTPIIGFATTRLDGEGEESVPTLAAAFPVEKGGINSPAATGIPLDYMTYAFQPDVDYDAITAFCAQFDMDRAFTGAWNYFDLKRNVLLPYVPPTQPPFNILVRDAALAEIMRRYPWDGSQWWPFWKNQGQVQAQLQKTETVYPTTPWEQRILAGLHYNPKRKTGMLFVSNLYSVYKKQVLVRLNLKQLGLPGNVRIVLPLAGGEKIVHDSGAFNLTIPGNNYEFLVIGNDDWDGRLRPWLTKNRTGPAK